MKYWNRLKKDVQEVMKQSADLFKEGTAVVAKETRRMAKKGASTVKSETQRIAKVGQIQYQLLRLNQKVQEKFAQIGGELYQMASKNPKRLQGDAKVQKLVREAKKLDQEMRKLKSEMNRLAKGRGTDAA